MAIVLPANPSIQQTCMCNLPPLSSHNERVLSVGAPCARGFVVIAQLTADKQPTYCDILCTAHHQQTKSMYQYEFAVAALTPACLAQARSMLHLQ